MLHGLEQPDGSRGISLGGADSGPTGVGQRSRAAMMALAAAIAWGVGPSGRLGDAWRVCSGGQCQYRCRCRRRQAGFGCPHQVTYTYTTPDTQRPLQRRVVVGHCEGSNSPLLVAARQGWLYPSRPFCGNKLIPGGTSDSVVRRSVCRGGTRRKEGMLEIPT